MVEIYKERKDMTDDLIERLWQAAYDAAQSSPEEVIIKNLRERSEAQATRIDELNGRIADLEEQIDKIYKFNPNEGIGF